MNAKFNNVIFCTRRAMDYDSEENDLLKSTYGLIASPSHVSLGAIVNCEMIFSVSVTKVGSRSRTQSGINKAANGAQKRRACTHTRSL